MGKGIVRAAIASEGYLSDDEFRLHDMHGHDQVFIEKFIVFSALCFCFSCCLLLL